jgi:lysyl-tRNA synthetase class 1
MDWLNTLASGLTASSPQLVNDSKTPSGRAHVGALRGVLIHDAAFRFLSARGLPVRYTFGVDDYDPLDELPSGQQDFFRPYLGRPLCNVPPPPGSSAPDLAEHFIGEFFGVFEELGVGATTYRLRDVYRSGQFDDAIRRILSHADTVRAIYKEVSNSNRPPDWYPFQVICESCGRIGTTEVFDFDGTAVRYRCRKDLVAWAAGCGHTGSVSPFGGNGKLPWKLEWTAKWHVFDVTIEGAGKDHSTKGGARDVASACLSAIFGKQPPRNIPYEFFLVGGSKMSSSKGVGAAARQVADLLPPEVLRFLMLKNPPSRQVNFSPDEDHLVKLFNEFDRSRLAVIAGTADEGTQELFRLCVVSPTDEVPAYVPPFQLLTTLLQLPHVDTMTEILKRSARALSPVEERAVARRLASAQYWLDHYAREDERLRIQQTLPVHALDLSEVQKAYLHRLAITLTGAPWEDDVLQAKVFDAARCTPIAASAAFEAIYRTFLDRSSGPRAGSLFSCLDRQFVITRLTEMPFSLVRFWRESAETMESFEAWLLKHRDEITIRGLSFRFVSPAPDAAADADTALQPFGVVECEYTNHEGRQALRRAVFSPMTFVKGDAASVDRQLAEATARYASGLSDRLGVRLEHSVHTRLEDLRELGLSSSPSG